MLFNRKLMNVTMTHYWEEEGCRAGNWVSVGSTLAAVARVTTSRHTHTHRPGQHAS